MDKFFDTVGVVATASTPYAIGATCAVAAAVVVGAVGLAWALPRLGRLLRVPQYKSRPYATPAE
jgi:uncharacterized membrane protein YhhN